MQAMRFILASRPGEQSPFDLSQETDRTRDICTVVGEWGQSLLVARRLIEAGVRMCK